jgi:hypothetical protein
MSPNNATSTAFRDESDRVSGVSVASRQASLPTVAGAEAASVSEGSPVEINRPIWAVDLGTEMRAVSTFELWMALSRGDYSTDVLVWRMGRECWSPAQDVPELACALAGVTPASNVAASRDSATHERATLDYAQTPTSGVFECNAAASRSDTASPEAALELDDSETPPATSATLAPSPLPLVEHEIEPAAHAVEAPRRRPRVRRVQPRLIAALGAALLTVSTLGLAAAHAPKAAAASYGIPAGRVTLEIEVPAQPIEAPAVETEAKHEETRFQAHPTSRPKRVSPQHSGQHRRRQR